VAGRAIVRARQLGGIWRCKPAEGADNHDDKQKLLHVSPDPAEGNGTAPLTEQFQTHL
jgi:hypothetical protein